MRTGIISDGWGISYPDTISFTFNRNLIRIQGATDDEVTVTVQRESLSYQDKGKRLTVMYNLTSANIYVCSSWSKKQNWFQVWTLRYMSASAKEEISNSS